MASRNEMIEAAAALLLVQAGGAHGVYEERQLGGVYDQEWPAWYAAYLVEHGIADLVGRPVAADDVARWLKACDIAHKLEGAGTSWPVFYARRLAELTRPGTD